MTTSGWSRDEQSKVSPPLLRPPVPGAHGRTVLTGSGRRDTSLPDGVYRLQGELSRHEPSDMRTSVRIVKRCLKCGVEKELDEFHRWRKGDGRQPWCKPCRKTYDAEYHQRVRERRRAQRQRRKVEFLRWYRALKESTPCTDCGERVHHAALQFDHLPGSDKAGDVGYLRRHSSKQLVLDEMAKCEPVCANCHAVRTFNRRNGIALAGAGVSRGGRIRTGETSASQTQRSNQAELRPERPAVWRVVDVSFSN